MGFRDRFFTPATARAILSWRILAGIGGGVIAGVAGAPIAIAALLGLGVYGGTVLAAMPRSPRRPLIDPFVLGEPWRQIVQGALSAERRLRATVDGVRDGPRKDTLRAIAEQLERGLDEAWQIARRGDEIDDAVRRLDPTSLRSKLATLEASAAEQPSAETESAIASVRRQLETSERLQRQSDETAASLRLTQTQLDELVARAAEVGIGAADTTAYRREVDDLVVRLEALHQAVEETRSA